MSLLEPHTVSYIVSGYGFSDLSSVHIWHDINHAICGATHANHECGDENHDWINAKNGDTDCRMCHKPLCVYCRLLLGWKV